MSLQSPFDSDFMAQLQSLQGAGGFPGRDPGDMGSREAFMRQLQATNQMQQQSFQNQMAAAQQGYGQQKDIMTHGTGLQSQAAASTMQTQAAIDQQARERHMQMMTQMQERANQLQERMVGAGAEEQAAMSQEYMGYKQRMNDLQSKIIKAEAHSSGIAQQSTVAKQKMLQSLDSEIKGMQTLKDKATVQASEFGNTFADRLANKLSAARNAQTGAGVGVASHVGNIFDPFGGYSDAHFAMQDENIAKLLALSGDAGKAIATKAGEGQILGAIGRAVRNHPVVSIGLGAGKTGTMQDRLAAAEEQLKVSNKGGVIFDAVGKDLAEGMGVTDSLKAQDLRALMMDLDTLQGIKDPAGSRQLYDEVKARIRGRVKNLGSTLGEEGVVHYLKTAADAMGSMSTTDEKGVTTRKSRFGGVTGTGDIADMQNAIGSALHTHLTNYANTLQAALGSDNTIRRVDDLVTLRSALADAAGVKEGGVSNLTAASLADIMKGKGGSMVGKDVQAAQSELDRLLRTGEGDVRDIADLKAREVAMASDPRNMEFQDVEGAAARKARTVRAREDALREFNRAHPLEELFRRR